MTYTESLEANEFILSLSNEYKAIFLKALAYLANVDGRRDEQEILYIKDAAEYYKIDCPEKLFEKVFSISPCTPYLFYKNFCVTFRFFKI